jgi:hypothetical protein
MRGVIELVYELRRLTTRCASSDGLDMNEIEALASLEEALRKVASDELGPMPIGPRPHIALGDRLVRLRNGDDDDPVLLAVVGTGGVMVTGAPFVEPGTSIEIVADDPAERRSYRFKGKVTSLEDDDDGRYRVCVELIGAPLLLRMPLTRPLTPIPVGVAA